VTAIDDYWREQGVELRSQFARIRRSHKDSDVKGTGNEAILAEFIQENMAARSLVVNSSIIDANGQQSDEIDVAICNEYQPFLARKRAELLIVEGVDAVVQSKARLDGGEITRTVNNCRTVKKLVRYSHAGDQTFVSEQDMPHTVFRVLYIGFAFETALTPQTAVEKLRRACEEVPPEEQPDAFFVLGKYSIVNVRENAGATQVQHSDGTPGRGFELVGAAEDTLADFMRMLYTMSPRILRWNHPLGGYTT
jgi:hypothetical protein